MIRAVTEVHQSLYFHPAAEVLITTCGHSHVRPCGYRRVGDDLDCPFCDDTSGRGDFGVNASSPLADRCGQTGKIITLNATTQRLGDEPV